MKSIQKRFSTVVNPLTAATLSFAICHSAYSLNLPDVPLLIEASVEPNVMLLLDDSGSMTSGWNYGDYSSGTDYANCDSANELDDRDSDNDYYVIDAHTDSNGYAYFTHDGTDYAWGNSGGTDANTGLPEKCFDDNDDYRVNYSDDFQKTEEGNFWNYYFSNSTQTDGDNWGLEDQKFGVGERIEVAQDAAKILIRNLEGIRIGLAGFNGSNGGSVLVGIDSLDEVIDEDTGETQLDHMVEVINEINASGYTPLGESLFEIGRYFIEGFTDQEITLHPDDYTGTEATYTASDVFDETPTYRSTVTVPSSSDPVIQAYCQKNFVVMLTDGAPTQDTNIGSYLPGYESNWPDPLNLFATTTGSNDVMDDVALALYDIDLRPDLNEFDGTPVLNNITTYLIAGFGLTPTTIMENTADYGVGKHVDGTEGEVYRADDGDALITAFDDIFEEIFSTAGSLASVSFNSGSLETGTALYQATFTRAEYAWRGDLRAYPYDSGTGLFDTTSAWSAADKLDEKVANYGHATRLIMTMSSSNDGIEFTEANWADLTSTQQNDLKGGGSDTDGKAVLNYLRGATNAAYRDRSESDGTLGLLGDIVNSSPIEVGEPEVGYPDYGDILDDGSTATLFGTSSDLYSNFESTYASRASMVYVGSNDGMVHGFYGDPSTGGDEVMAYIPSMVFDSSSNTEGLYYLTDPEYGHRFYVDGSLTASDVYLDPDGGSSKSWRTILLGGLRAGGRGLYALDITDPSVFASAVGDAAKVDNIVMWEFDGNDDGDMGHVYGEIRVSMMANGKWAAILGNGYNSDSGEAKVFIIYIEEGADGSWTTGEWIELDTGITGDNGMGPPVLADLDGDYVVDRIYAGDLKGNLWAFDVTSTSDGSWSSAYMDGSTPKPLFTATDSDGTAQPFTTQPIITTNPENSTAGNGVNVQVYIGAGKFIESDDYLDNSSMTFYSVWDRGSHSLGRSNLTARTLTSTTGTDVDGNTFESRGVSGSDISWFNGTSGSYGWYMDLPELGERVIVEPYVLQGAVFFATSLPSTTSCSNGGKGWVLSVSTNGLEPTTPIFDANGDGLIDENDLGYVGEQVLGGLPSGAAYIGGGSGSSDPCPKQNGQYQAFSTSSGEIHYRWVCPPDGAAVGRMSWQEMLRQ